MLKRQERDIGDPGAKGYVQRREIGRCGDEPPVGQYTAQSCLPELRPDCATCTSVGIDDDDDTARPAVVVKLGLGSYPNYAYRHAAPSIPDSYYVDFAQAPWAIKAARIAVEFGNFDFADLEASALTRRKLFAEMGKVMPPWGQLPELYIWTSRHVTANERGGHGRISIWSMAELLASGPAVLAERVDDASLSRRLLLGYNDLLPRPEPKAERDDARAFLSLLLPAKTPTSSPEFPSHLMTRSRPSAFQLSA